MTHPLAFCSRKPSLRLRFFVAALGAFVGQPGAADVLATLRPAHPRLFFTGEDFQRTKGWAATDSLVAKAYTSLKKKADQTLAKPSLAYTLDATPEQRLLVVSRDALDRISLLAAMYRMEKDARYRDGALKCLREVAAFPDWHPPHFLDVAEMTLAVALGYDWLHEELPPGLRDTLRQAIARHGLNPGMEAYRRKANFWWTTNTNNWNQVCNGGLALGALAIAEDSADLSRRLLDSALTSIRVSMNFSYAPDGGYPEGLGYWEYGTNYAVFLLAGLQSALGNTHGLLESPGFAQTADYRLHMVGPTNQRFNYADQGATNNFVGNLFWFANTFQRPFYARTERINPGTPNIFALLWYDPTLAALPDTHALARAVRYRNLDVAVFRSSWTDSGAWYVGFKGGDNAASHAHLDLGTFVLEQGGVRWASDLGADSYGVPNYFQERDVQDGAHWRMFRTRTEGHNTLAISSRNQTPLAFANQAIRAKSPLMGFHAATLDSWSVADLTAAYAPLATDPRAVSRVHRGVRLWPGQFLVQDEIESTAPTEVVWNLVTEAAVTLSGNSLTLTRKGRTMRLEIVTPATAVFDTVTCHPPDARTQAQKDAGAYAENPNTGFTKVIVRLPLETTRTTLAVRFFPGGTAPTAPAIRALSEWISSGTARRSRPEQIQPRSTFGRELSTGRSVPLSRPLPEGIHLVRDREAWRLVAVGM